MQKETDILLQGIRVTAEFLLEAEADALCGARKNAQCPERTNYRRGYHTRMLRMRIGDVSVRVPSLRYLHMRPSMAKRFCRLQDEFVKTLSDALAHGAREKSADALITAMWTVSMNDTLRAELTRELCKVMKTWREENLKSGSMPGGMNSRSDEKSARAVGSKRNAPAP